MKLFSFNVNKYWLAYFLIKVIYLFLAILVYSKFTILGDTEDYLNGSFSEDFLYNSTSMMKTFAGFSASLLGNVIGNIPFVFLSFYGVYYSVSRLCLNTNQLIFILFLLSFPSFGIWTSIASKEAVAVFYMGIFCGVIVDYVKKRRVDFKLLILAFYLCVIFKPQYLVGLSAMFIFVWSCRTLSANAYTKLFLLVMFFLLSWVLLYLFKDNLNALVKIIPLHFDQDASSTRDNVFWINENDVFWSAPYGMFISFWGPTFNEAIAKPTHFLVWLESFLILFIFAISFLKLFLFILKTERINVYLTGIFLTCTLWILFVHYPFGVLNPGSAVRYREGFYGFLVVIFYFTFLENFRSYTKFRNL